MAFVMVAISLRHNTVAVSFGFMPLSFVDILVGVYHASLSLWHAIYPVSIITIAIFVKESSTAVLFVFEPVASIFTSQLFVFISPVGTLSMSFVDWPHAFILVSVFIILNSKTLFAIIAPVTNVLWRWQPFVTFNCAVLLSFLFLNPEHGSMSAILLRLRIITVIIRYNNYTYIFQKWMNGCSNCAD